MSDTQIKLFDNQNIRTLWDEKQEKWYFSIVDIIAALTESVDATAYWRKLKQRLKAEGNETVTNCHALKMVAKDGKLRLTDAAERLWHIVPDKNAVFVGDRKIIVLQLLFYRVIPVRYQISI